MQTLEEKFALLFCFHRIHVAARGHHDKSRNQLRSLLPSVHKVHSAKPHSTRHHVIRKISFHHSSLRLFSSPAQNTYLKHKSDECYKLH
jgi:hypothetical protein